jgi:5-methyltetrahydropteroyltriglutamate--homocysteine methyltransferase
VLDEFLEQKELGIENGKPVLVGPVSYLLLGKEKQDGFHRLQLIKDLLPAYFEIIDGLVKKGCNYIQFDEPYLVTDLDCTAKSIYAYAYDEINKKFPNLKIVLATYFDDLGDNLTTVVGLPFHVLHIDLVRGARQLDNVLDILPKKTILSLGIVDGRNIWKNNFEQSLEIIDRVVETLGSDRVWIAPSCSLLHCPYDLDLETNEKILPADEEQWISFSKQKIGEVVMLKKLKNGKEKLSDNDFNELINNSS